MRITHIENIPGAAVDIRILHPPDQMALPLIIQWSPQGKGDWHVCNWRTTEHDASKPIAEQVFEYGAIWATVQAGLSIEATIGQAQQPEPAAE